MKTCSTNFYLLICCPIELTELDNLLDTRVSILEQQVPHSLFL